ncbi:MAG: lipoate--protein ligase [Clostridiales bacterium]|nr:lipoate--protein ligase [Clostridiales bacterium]
MIQLINQSTDPYFNLALEEYLFEQAGERAYFWLWQNDNTVVIGKNQNAAAEVNADYIRENRVKVARRITGGGAVYHDLGNVNFTFIVPSHGKRNVDFAPFTDTMTKALQAFGLQVERSGRNDLLLGGRKFSGNAQLVGKSSILHHGTLLFSSDLNVMAQCLTPPQEKLKSHGVASVQSRVTTLAQHLPRNISLETFMDELAAQICPTNPRGLTEDEIAAVTALRDKKFATDAWIYGTSPAFDYANSKRFACGTVSLSLRLQAGRIETCCVTGDFFGNGDMRELEKRLTNQTNSRESILAALAPIDLNHYLGNLTVSDFLSLFNF